MRRREDRIKRMRRGMEEKGNKDENGEEKSIKEREAMTKIKPKMTGR